MNDELSHMSLVPIGVPPLDGGRFRRTPLRHGVRVVYEMRRRRSEGGPFENAMG
jgi:hypothetical protein